MSLRGGHAALERETARLDPYARMALSRAADFALWLHATEVTQEHLLASLLRDEECGATRLVLHAFADPQTIGSEVLALCPGILVVASGGSLPFSVRSLRALERARAEADPVDPIHVFRAAQGELPEPILEALLQAGLLVSSSARNEVSESPPGSFFGSFSLAGRRVLGAACRVAHRFERSTISPAHLMLGSLESEASIQGLTGISAGRLRILVSGREADETPPADHELEPDPGLLDLLSSLPAGAGTTEMLGGILIRGREEVRALLSRQKITPALHERFARAFRDPAPPSPR